MSLKDTLEKYSSSNIYPFHMPGHKRQLEGSYKIDMTEVEGVDDLHDPTDVILYEQNRLAKLYGADIGFMLVGGSTVGNLSVIYGALNEGDFILIQRNSHRSVYNGAIIRHLRVGYIYPQIDENGIFNACTLKDIKYAIEISKELPKAIVITSPTYEGYLCDVENIAKFCHERNIILIVDEAHGAHLGFNEYFKGQASRFADATVMSFHKTLPCLTQTAALLVNTSRIDENKIRQALDIFETSSPSYVLMNSISECLDLLEKPEDYFENYVDNLKNFYHVSGKSKHLKILDDSIENKDPGKIIISTKDTNISGVDLALRLRNEFEIETELSSFSYVLAMTSIMDTKEGFDRLKKALIEIDNSLKPGQISVPINTSYCEKKIELWESKTSEAIEIDIKDSKDKVSQSMVCLYPPGAPVVVPGEVISEETIDIIEKAMDVGIHVTGINKGRICVVN